jgi:hypothetical protein
MPESPRDSYAALWILFSAWLVLSGWTLSMIGVLGAGGYIASLILFAVLVLVLVNRKTLAFRKPHLPRLWRRFRRPLPLIYLVCLTGSFIGGLLHAPTNYDGITYRVPRVLHWLNEGKWHWIGSWNVRMDYSSTGMEWLMAPQLALFHTDRLFFLINIFSYALLPGLLYAAFYGLGISRRVAWYWMWLLPTGYCFVTQAGSIGNDSFAVVFFLAAISFGVRCLRSHSSIDLSIAMLSAGLLTGAKASNLPLLLPICVVLLLATWAVLRDVNGPKFIDARLASLFLVGLATLSVSFLPVAIFNTSYTGEWSGDPTNRGQLKLNDPVAGLVGNSIHLAIGSITPPIFPMASQWNEAAQTISSSGGIMKIRDGFPRFSLVVSELPSEEGAGLGLGVSAIILLSLFFGICAISLGVRSWFAMGIGLACWVALGAYMAKMGSESTARILATYYPGLLLPLLGMNAQTRIVRQGWWRILAIIAALTAIPALVLSPSRPLFPVNEVLSFAERNHFISPRLIERARTVYTVYASRNDNLAIVRENLPSSARNIGFVGNGDESEFSIWRPLGQRSVRDLIPLGKKIPSLQGLDCVVGSDSGFYDRYGLTAEQFAATVGGRVIWDGVVSTRAGSGPFHWSIISLE